MQWTVAQIGAREHYAVPRALFLENKLRRLYTDLWCRHGSSILKRGPHTFRSFAGRYHPGLPSKFVTGFSVAAMLRRRNQSTRTDYEEYADEGKWFALRVRDHLARERLDPNRDAFFGFFTGCLETLEYLAPRGITTMVDQADAARVHYEITTAEVRRWPGWQEVPPVVPDFYFDRLSDEWRLATRVLVNSEWSRDALVRQQVPIKKIVVVPLAWEGHAVAPREPRANHPLTVLWVGNVNLTKGIQYLIEAAKLLCETDIRFVVAGRLGISKDAINTAPANITFLGAVSRDRVGDLYRDADVFVLPTLSDGFALTQLEAMSYGVPVITTPNCGRVVSHEVDGLIIPAANGQALAQAIARLDSDRSLLNDMVRRAPSKCAEFSLANYASRVEAAAAEAQNS